MRDFNPQALGNLAWAFAMVGHKEELLFVVLAAATERCTKDYALQNFLNAA